MIPRSSSKLKRPETAAPAARRKGRWDCRILSVRLISLLGTGLRPREGDIMTAKELAKILGLSEASVSFALNGKPGVSTKTRNRVLEEAEKYGIQVSRKAATGRAAIYLIYYKKHGAVLTDSTFFSELTEGVEEECAREGYRVNILNVYTVEDLSRQLEELANQGAAGFLVLGTEMHDEDFAPLPFCKVPVLLLDNHFLSSRVDSVRINNVDGAYQATNYLIRKLKTVPGYLHSSYPITNFDERMEGFQKALRHNGMSISNALIHHLAPSIDGACGDMREILNQGETPARCYFADNDQIAIGAMRAFREKGYQVPGQISLIGFDDIQMCNYTEPPLSSVHVPKYHLGLVAAERLIRDIGQKDYYAVNIEVSTNLVLRGSI